VEIIRDLNDAILATNLDISLLNVLKKGITTIGVIHQATPIVHEINLSTYLGRSQLKEHINHMSL
jgi:hypothetical protein